MQNVQWDSSMKNIFIHWVEKKPLKISHFCRVFLTPDMKKLPYLKLGSFGNTILIYLLLIHISKNVSACLNGHGDVLSYLMTELTDLKENVFDLVNMKNQTPLHLAAASPSAGKLC